MAAILADNIFKHIFLNDNIRISIQISLKFVPKGLIDDKSALVQVMAWHQTGDKPLPEAMKTQFADTCMWHLGGGGGCDLIQATATHLKICTDKQCYSVVVCN